LSEEEFVAGTAIVYLHRLTECCVSLVTGTVKAYNRQLAMEPHFLIRPP